MAATTTDTTTAFTINLVNDTRHRRVLFAKTTTDVVDFLYSLLNSPDSPISADDLILGGGCTDNIARSVEELDYLVAESEYDSETEDEDEDAPPSPPPEQQQARRRLFACGVKSGAGCDGYLAERSDARCPSCGWLMDAEVSAAPGAGCSRHAASASGWLMDAEVSAAPGAGCSRHAAGSPEAGCSGQAAAAAAAAAPLVTCPLMDDLSIGPAPDDIIGLAIMRGASATALQEETVRLGRKEGLEILKASLKSSTVLTDVFLGDDKAPAAGAPS
ncbi:unnamed protein product [Urochloa humidicola]